VHRKSVSPAGDRVEITGTGLLATTAVKFGPNPAPQILIAFDGEVTAVVPPGTSGSQVPVVVVTAAGATSGPTSTYD
jgi:hypothetical protein